MHVLLSIALCKEKISHVITPQGPYTVKNLLRLVPKEIYHTSYDMMGLLSSLAFFVAAYRLTGLSTLSVTLKMPFFYFIHKRYIFATEAYIKIIFS